jgi:methylmalonyl-CoA carboxyltransferase large subunit
MPLFSQFVLQYTELAIVIAVVAAGYVAIYVMLRLQLERTVEKLRGEWAEEFRSLMVATRTEGKASAPVVPAAATAPIVQLVATPPPVAFPVPIPAKRPEVTPEIMLVIAAAVTAFLGKKVRIRSARILYSHESFNPWSQQGRAVVQASHNVAQRVH